MSESNQDDIVELDASVLAHYMEELAKSLRVVHSANAEQLNNVHMGMQEIAERMAILQQTLRNTVEEATEKNVVTVMANKKYYDEAIGKLRFKTSEVEEVISSVEKVRTAITVIASRSTLLAMKVDTFSEEIETLRNSVRGTRAIMIWLAVGVTLAVLSFAGFLFFLWWYNTSR